MARWRHFNKSSKLSVLKGQKYMFLKNILLISYIIYVKDGNVDISTAIHIYILLTAF